MAGVGIGRRGGLRRRWCGARLPAPLPVPVPGAGCRFPVPGCEAGACADAVAFAVRHSASAKQQRTGHHDCAPSVTCTSRIIPVSMWNSMWQ